MRLGHGFVVLLTGPNLSGSSRGLKGWVGGGGFVEFVGRVLLGELIEVWYYSFGSCLTFGWLFTIGS